MKKVIFLVLLCLSVSIFAKEQHVVFETSKGKIEFRFFPEIAPKAVENFIGLTKKGYYNGVIFHRVIKDFMIQGGDPDGTGRGGDSIWGGPFDDEFAPGVVFDRSGILAMANSGRNTNRSQFFITTKPASWLNGKYTIFGEVVDGYDVVSAIENSKVNGRNRPLYEVRIIKAYVK